MSYNLVYNPTIRQGATTLSVPVPLLTTDETFNTRVRSVEVPLANGVTIASVRRAPLTVSGSGIITADSRGELLNIKDSLVAVMNKNTLPFDFYRYYDPAHNYYRWYKNAVCQNLSFGNTSKTVLHLPYNFSLLVPSGREYVSGVFPDVGGSEGTPGADPVPTDDLELEGSMIIQLADSAGASSVTITDSTGTPIFRVNSLGTVQYKGLAYSQDPIT